MKRILGKFLCVFLAAVMAFSGTVVAYADTSVTPVIMVHGLGAFSVYENPTSSDKEELGSFDVASLLTSTTKNNALHSLLNAISGKSSIDASTFIDYVGLFLQDFADLACDSDGNPASNTGIADYWTDSMANHTSYYENATSNEPALVKTLVEEVGASNVYCFNYDWRVDACENGEKLDAFIDIVKQQTGKSKVTLVGASEGTCVVSAYIDAHKGDNELEKVVFLNGAMNGVGIAKVFNEDLYFDADTLLDYLYELTQTYKNSSIDMTMLSWLSTTMQDSADNLCDILNEILGDRTLLEKVYNELLLPIFGNIPILWEFIPYEAFDSAVQKMTDIGFLNQSSGLYQKISYYHGVQGRLESNLKSLKKKGVEIAIVANYGTPAIPITSARIHQSDVLIETQYASLGATVALYDYTLKSSQTKKNKYASADELIDASTAAFPNRTWFIKGVQHMNYTYGSGATNFICTLITTTGTTTVSSIKKLTGLGRYISADSSQNVTNVTGSNTKTTKIKKVTKKTSSSVKLTWKKKSGIMGYQIQYSTSSKFTKKKTKSVTVSSAKTTTKTLKKLKSNKTYYIRIRTYKIVANKKIYSSWSTVKTVKTKKA